LLVTIRPWVVALMARSWGTGLVGTCTLPVRSL
jgi:hypothetical protein